MNDPDTILHPPGSSSEGPSAGECLGRLKVLRRIGSGGRGVVYLARHLDLGRDFAIKFLRGRDSAPASFPQELRQEARLLGGLVHPHIVAVTDFGHWRRQPFLVMEYAEGGSLAALLQESGGRLPPEEARRLMAEALSGLAHAHEAGVVHGDVKPANILLTAERAAKVADFGLAFPQLDRPRSPPVPLDAPLDEGETLPAPWEQVSTGGTPAYMAPEQRFGQPATPASDVWSFGATLYQVLTGRAAQGLALPPSQAVPGLDPRWDCFVARCLEPDPAQRYASASEALADLPGRRITAEPLATAEPPPLLPSPATGSSASSGPRLSPNRGAWVAALLLLAAGVVAAAWFLSRRSAEDATPDYQPGGGREIRPLRPGGT